MNIRKVFVDGTEAANVIRIEYDKQEGANVGQATIEVINSQTNRDLFESGSDVTIKRQDPNNPGTYVVDWVGEVLTKPSTTSKRNATLEVTAETLIGQLAYATISRPFIQLDTGDVVKEAVNKRIEASSERTAITNGDDLTDWSSDAQLFQLGDITVVSVQEYGSDFFYAEIPKGSTGDRYIRNTSVASSLLPGRRIQEVFVRYAVNNRGGFFDAFVEARDHDGVNYRWNLDAPEGSGFQTAKLTPGDATFPKDSDFALSTNGSIQFRVSLSGGIPEPRAFAVDTLQVTPFGLTDRNTAVSPTEVELSGRTITREIDANVLEMIDNLATEDGAVVYVDNNDVLHYETGGNTSANKSIQTGGDPPIVNVTVDRDFDKVRNKVTVQGKDDLVGTFRDLASINFYNVESPKEKPIVDTSIRTESGLKTRAIGFLNDKAWEDTALSFTIADSTYQDVRVGQTIDVTWGPEDVDGVFVVTSIESTPEGYITLGMSGTTEV